MVKSDKNFEWTGESSIQYLETVSRTYVPAEEIDKRIDKFQRALSVAELDGALIRQNVDLYYFSGTMQDCYLYVPRNGEPLLLAYRHLERASHESGLTGIVALKSLRALPQVIQDNGLVLPNRLGVEMDVLPASLYLKLDRLFESGTLHDVSLLIRGQRKNKSPYEIEQIRKAGEIAHKMHVKGKEVFRTGISEVEAQGILEAEARRHGHPGIVRMRSFNQEMVYGHLISGPEGLSGSILDAPTGGLGVSAAFSHGASTKKFRPGEPINLDLMGHVNGYLEDQTRCFCIGKPPEELESAYDAVRKILQGLTATALPGLPVNSLYEKAYAMADNLGYGDCFMGSPDYRPKFIGHGIGLEADEFPFVTARNNDRLEEGMVVALEPKIFLPGLGVVGIEDTVHITEEGAVSLTISPKELVVLKD